MNLNEATSTGHPSYLSRPAEVTAPVLVVMGEQDPDFPDPAAEAAWIAQAMRAQVVMVPEAGHYPQSQQPEITAGAVLRFLAAVPSPP
jgi:pimeloyl-ACP methyl ester carboxylesterase